MIEKPIKKKERGTKTSKKRKYSDVKENELTNSGNAQELLDSEWDQLHVPNTITTALNEINFNLPTDIQREVLPSAIQSHYDILGAAPTGSGKTLAFGIPMLCRILESRVHNQKSSSCDFSKKNKKKKIDEDFVIVEELDPITAEVKTEHKLSESENVEKDFSQNDINVMGLVILPTRELALQVNQHIEMIAKRIEPPIRVVTIVGGISIQKQIRLLKGSPEIVIATPGRLWQLLNELESPLSNIRDTLRCLVIDEADRLIDGHHYEELRLLLRFLNSSSESLEDIIATSNDDNSKKTLDERIEESCSNDFKRKRQTLVFSATLSFVHSGAISYGSKKIKMKKRVHKPLNSQLKLDMLRETVGLRKKFKTVDLSIGDSTIGDGQSNKNLVKSSFTGIGVPQNLIEYRLACPTKMSKDARLLWLLMTYRFSNNETVRSLPSKRCIVFVNSKAGVRRIAGYLRLIFETKSVKGCNNLSILHSDMLQKHRFRSLEKFRSDPNGVLLASDVAARGLDLAGTPEKDCLNSASIGVGFVVHFEVPHTAECYIHRRGRTARAERSGQSILLINPEEQIRWRKICTSLNKKDTEMCGLGGELNSNELKRVEAIVGLSISMNLEMHRVEKNAQENNWFVRAAKEADIDFSEEEMLKSLTGGLYDEQQDGWKRKLVKKRKKTTPRDVQRNNLKDMINEYYVMKRKHV